MPKTCSECQSFARHNPRTQAIAGELQPHEPTVISELLRLMQDERQLMDAEAELRLELLRADEQQWPAMPLMSDFCALHYNSGSALAHEVKNAESDCLDWKSGAPPSHPCLSCRFRIAGIGHADAMKMQEQMRAIADLSSAVGRPDDPGFSTHQAALYARMAFEVAQAYSFGHSGALPPSFLPYCGRYSSPSEHVFCATRNLHARCPGWQSATPDISAPRELTPGSLVAATARK